MAEQYILKPYMRRRSPGPFRRFLAYAGLVFVAAFYGLMTSILPLQFLAIPLVPVLIMGGIILWMLPDRGGIHYDLMAKLMLLYVGFSISWPFYVAFDAPGLPWITPTRVFVGMLALVFLLNLAMSAELRSTINSVMKAVPDTRRLFWFYCLLTAISLVFSPHPINSLTRFINNQIYWTMMFVVAMLLASREGFVIRLSRVLVVTLIFVSLLGLYEASIQEVFWMSRLPSFLSVDPTLLATFADAQNRAGTSIYRVRGTMGVSLYYAEYLALVFPLLLHFIFRKQAFYKTLLLLLGGVAVACNMYLTNARSSMVGLIVAMVAYAFYNAFRAWRQRPNSILSAASFFAFPAAVGLLFTLMLTWNRLRVMTIGGGQHQASSEARNAQWTMGIPKAMTHPFGHGTAQSGEALGFTNAAGEVTVDSYFLTVLLEYGWLGMVTFILLLASTVWLGFLLYQTAQTKEEQLAGPLSIGMLNILIVKSVLSSEINLPIAFIMAGCLVGLAYQRQVANRPVTLRKLGPAHAVQTLQPGSAALA
jgi:hypothetical protein